MFFFSFCFRYSSFFISYLSFIMLTKETKDEMQETPCTHTHTKCGWYFQWKLMSFLTHSLTLSLSLAYHLLNR